MNEVSQFEEAKEYLYSSIDELGQEEALKALPYEIFWDLVQNYEFDVFSDIELLFSDIKRHVKIHGGHIVSADNPQQLRLGWCCSKTGKLWEIRMSNIRRCQNHSKRQYFGTQNGRQAICDLLNDTSKYNVL